MTKHPNFLHLLIIHGFQVQQTDYLNRVEECHLMSNLNLKTLNKECDKAHFKMESLKQALHMVRKGTFLASIDIKDAFYSVPIKLIIFLSRLFKIKKF